MMVLDALIAYWGDGWEFPKAKSLSESPKIPKLLDRRDGRAYYFGRRTAENFGFL